MDKIVLAFDFKLGSKSFSSKSLQEEETILEFTFTVSDMLSGEHNTLSTSKIFNDMTRSFLDSDFTIGIFVFKIALTSKSYWKIIKSISNSGSSWINLVSFSSTESSCLVLKSFSFSCFVIEPIIKLWLINNHLILISSSSNFLSF
jgi:hypothetical protein